MNLVWWAAFCVPPAIYFIYVAHYSVNVPYWDDWNLIPLAHAAIHGQLSFSQLWAQYNENRMLTANLLFATFGREDHLNTLHMILFSASLFVASYCLFIACQRAYSAQRLSTVHLLLVGGVWFSLEDYQNALWSYQLAWYLILFLLMGMLFAFSRHRVGALHITVACILAVMASFSSLQGLILWPVGLVCIAWRMRDKGRVLPPMAAWSMAMVVTFVLYFRGFNFSPDGTGGGSIAFSLNHPIGMIKYFLAALGNIIPTTAEDLRIHESLGVLVAILAVVVLYRSIRRWPEENRLPLPPALIIFGLLFDASIAMGRLNFGVSQSLSSRYTMANLLVLMGLVSYAIPRFRFKSLRISQNNAILSVAAAVLCVVMVFQIVVATRYGVSEGEALKTSRVLDARTVANLSSIPDSEKEPLVSAYVYPTLSQLEPWVVMAKEDRLSIFATGDLAKYRQMGAPPG